MDLYAYRVFNALRDSSNLWLIISLITIVEACIIYKKMNIKWWIFLIPFYGTYRLYKKLYGSGLYYLLHFIPIIGSYYSIKTIILLARSFNKGIIFAIGIALFPTIFLAILAFDNSQYEETRTNFISVVAILYAIASNIVYIFVIQFLIILFRLI